MPLHYSLAEAEFCVWDPALKEDDNCVQALTLRYEELN